MISQNLPSILRDSIKVLTEQEHLITDSRRAELADLASQMVALKTDKGSAKVTFVCTHNSRRSQLAELWLRTAASYYSINDLLAYSGGTASTAFNPRMVAALERFGFVLDKKEDVQNPTYVEVSGSSHVQQKMFSKKYDAPYNPNQDFIAVMVCAQADRDCPFVPGAWARVSLPYLDPKVADDGPQEASAYDNKVKEIGREMLYLASQMQAN
ncbi:MAG: protein-tyrosine-phosphatase [Saprospiraceae bacterium]|nr:protein-tyrosine-phosphatase [Saprospiraceae bacterium]